MVFKTLIFITILWPGFSFASDNCPTKLSRSADVLSCAEAASPEVQSATLELNVAKQQLPAATQWKNPEFTAETFFSTADTSSSETDFGLGIPIELGGKRGARGAVASGAIAQAEARLLIARSSVRSATLLKMHRLRQIAHEQEIIEESIGTYTKLISTYQRRPQLSPEQEVSVAVFRLSKSEYELKRTEVLEELSALENFFLTTVGRSVSSLIEALPESPKRWPTLPTPNELTNAPELLLADAQLKIAQAELALAKSDRWPTLTLGPSLKMQRGPTSNEQMLGVNLSLPLPVFNSNQAGQAAASASLQLSEANRRFKLQAAERDRSERVANYQRSIKALAESLSHEEIEKRHAQVEKLFLRGVAPSSLVIEAHRSFLELERIRNERELKALESLLTIYLIDGKVLEVEL